MSEVMIYYYVIAFIYSFLMRESVFLGHILYFIWNIYIENIRRKKRINVYFYGHDDKPRSHMSWPNERNTKRRGNCRIVLQRTVFTLACLKRNAVLSTVVEICFLNNPNGSRNESTRWQTTHNRRHGAPRPAELYEFCWGLVGLEVADVSVGPTGNVFPPSRT